MKSEYVTWLEPENFLGQGSITLDHLAWVHEQPDTPDRPEFESLITIATYDAVPANMYEVKNSLKDIFLFLGFCNRERRPFLSLSTVSGKTIELVSNHVLPAREEPYHFAVQLDWEKRKLRLLVDFETAAETSLDTSLSVHNAEIMCFSMGLVSPYVTSRIFRKLLTFGELRIMKDRLPADFAKDWEIEPSGYGRFKLFESGILAYCAVNDWIWKRHFSSGPSFEKRFVAFSPSLVDDSSDNEGERKKKVSNRLEIVTNLLEEIVKDESKTENDLLLFFKQNPDAVFLLDPDMTEIWREVQLQDYGQIDFVTKTIDGSFNVFEIEPAQLSLFKKSNEFTSPLHHAIDQVATWIRGVSRSDHAVRRRFGNAIPEMFCGIVVGGRKSELSNQSRMERWHNCAAKLLTWDDVISRGRNLIDRLNNPQLGPMNWNK